MQIKIYHTNDLHADYHTLRNIKAFLKKNMTENDIYLDSGDFCDLRDLIVQCDKGYTAADLFKDIPLSAMAVGNGEVDLSHDALIHLGEKLPLLACNLTDNNHNKLPNIGSSIIIERLNKKFLIIGLTAFYNRYLVDSGYNVFAMMGNLMFNPPEAPLQEELDKHKDQYDYCILLSHCGATPDEYILSKVSGIDLTLGGHSHEIINHKGYSQSGKGQKIGIITLELTDDSVEEIDSVLVDIPELEDEDFDELLKEKQEYADKVLSKELDCLEDLEHNPFEESQLTNFIADCLLKTLNGDLAIIHGGIAEGSLLKPVSRKELIENFPSKLNPTAYNIKGKNIIEAIKLSLNNKHIHDPGRGPGFRGKVLGNLAFSSNVKIGTSPFLVTINGCALEEEKEYRIVTDDYLQRGTGYPMLAVENDKCEYHIWFIRDMVQNHLMDKEAFSSSRIKRIIK